MAEIGSSEWWGQESDKLVNFGLGVLGTALLGGHTKPNQESEPTTSVMSGKGILPWVIIGAIGVGIVVILVKR